MKVFFLKYPIVKYILSALTIAGFGFLLLIVAFIFDFLFQSLIDRISGLFSKNELIMGWLWFPRIKHLLFVIIIGLISWFIFKSKLNTLYKAIYMPVPLAVVFVTLGMFLYHWPAVVYLLGGLFSLGVLYYFYHTKQPWPYFYALILVSFVMLLVPLLGIEI